MMWKVRCGADPRRAAGEGQRHGHALLRRRAVRAVGLEGGTVDEAGLIAGEEDDRSGDLGWLPCAPVGPDCAMAPSAFVPSVPSLKIVVTSDSAADTIAAAPMPWTKRATASAVESLANPAVLDGHVKVVPDRREGHVHDRPIGEIGERHEAEQEQGALPPRGRQKRGGLCGTSGYVTELTHEVTVAL
jgi:hypothetical protein